MHTGQYTFGTLVVDRHEFQASVLITCMGPARNEVWLSCPMSATIVTASVLAADTGAAGG